MKHQSFYDIVCIEPDRVFIIDLDLPGSRSVTNDAECVWVEIQKSFPGRRLIYRDSIKRWDEITCGPRGGIIPPHMKYKFYNIDFVPYKEHLPII